MYFITFYVLSFLNAWYLEELKAVTQFQEKIAFILLYIDKSYL